MAIKKLTDGPVTMVIQSARLVEGQYGTQVQFVGIEEGAQEDTLLYVAERSAIRQLERLALSLESCGGQTLHFEQVQRNGKTYNNIQRASGSPVAAVQHTPVQQEAHPVSQANNNSTLNPATTMLYEDCLKYAARAVISMSEDTGVQVSASDIVAAAATLFIQANRR